jgi:hypothetical protein
MMGNIAENEVEAESIVIRMPLFDGLHQPLSLCHKDP